MNAKSLFAGMLLAGAVFVAILFVYARSNNAAASAERERQSAELAEFKARNAALQDKLAQAEKERDRLKAEAAEIHKLRGEISTLRKANATLEKQAAQPPRAAVPETGQPTAPPGIPGNFGSYSELAQFAGGLRAKQAGGAPLSAEETAWLQQMKPELEKLETSPKDFAAFQASMIQTVAGVTDPEKVDRIRQGIQKVYENAVSRGLTLDRRPAEDTAAWMVQRNQLDRRGTTMIHRVLDENERAAFDRSFLGVMGVDLGTGVDKTLYPRGFLQE